MIQQIGIIGAGQMGSGIAHVAALNGVGHLIGFLDSVGCNSLKSLFHIPWAPGTRCAKLLHDFHQAHKARRHAGVY